MNDPANNPYWTAGPKSNEKPTSDDICSIMEPLGYLDHLLPNNNEINKPYLDFYNPLASHVHSYPDLCHCPSGLQSMTVTDTAGSYLSSPLTGSSLGHPFPLPQVPDDKALSSQDESVCNSDMHDEHRILHLPLSPPHTVPTATLALHLDKDVSFLPSPLSSSGSSPELVQDLLSDDLQDPMSPDSPQLQTPLSTTDWLTIDGSPMSILMEHDHVQWADDNSLQPLCSESTRSVWSPNSPLQSDELEMDSELSSSPSSPSWSVELSPDSPPLCGSNWSNQLSLGWSRARGIDDDNDYYVDSGSFPCLQTIFSPPSPPPYRHFNTFHDRELHHFLDDPMADLDYESSSFELLRSPVHLSIPLQIADTDYIHSDTERFLPASPPRRTVLPDLGRESSKMDTAPLMCHQSPTSSRILSLPGAETDDELLSPPGSGYGCSFADIDVFPMTGAIPEGLGISLTASTLSTISPTDTSSSLPEYTNLEDLYVDFPELEGYPYQIPSEVPSSIAAPDYTLAKLVKFCRRAKQAERNAKQRETEQGALVTNILKSLLPPFDDDNIAKRNKIRELQSAADNRAEAKKIRKKERERCREVRSLLTLKLGGIARERACAADVLLDEQRDDKAVASRDELSDFGSPGKKWMANDMNQLVAKMVLRRRERFRPLGYRQNARTEYAQSSLSSAQTIAEEEKDVVRVDDDDDDDDDGEDRTDAVIPWDSEETRIPPISN